MKTIRSLMRLVAAAAVLMLSVSAMAITVSNYTVLIDDQFNDGDPATNIGGTGTGFATSDVYNAGSAATETNGLLTLAPVGAGGGKGIQVRGNDSFDTTHTNEYRTRATWSIASIQDFDTSWSDILSLRTTTAPDTAPASPLDTPKYLGFYVVLAISTWQPGLYYGDGITLTTLAQWDWNVPTLTNGAVIQLDVAAASYSLLLSNVTITSLTGSLSGSLATPGPSSAYVFAMHAPVSSSNPDLARAINFDLIQVEYIPEPSTLLLFVAGLGVLCHARTKNRQ